MINKNLLHAAVTLTLTCSAMSVSADLPGKAELLMDPQTGFCDFDLGTYPDACVVRAVPDANYFAMDNSGDGVFDNDERVAIEPGLDGGIALGKTQTFGTSTGTGTSLVITAPGDIDAGWGFFNAAGWHTQAGTVSVASDDGAGSATLDMTGWTVNWNGGDIDMGQGAAAILSCGVDCATGDSFVLDYSAVVPDGGFAGVAYQLHLTGTVGGSSAVPVPAAVWLFGSGLLGLVGVARRRKAA